jgi:WD40 repeat protein
MGLVPGERAEQPTLSGVPVQRGTVPGGARVGIRLLRVSPALLALCAFALLLALRDDQSASPGGKNLGTHPGKVGAVAFSPDGRWLASGGWDCPIVVRDLSQAGKSIELPGSPHSTFRLAFSPDGSCLAAAGLNRSLRLWRTADWSPPRVLQDHTGVVRSLAFSPDGALLATAGADGVLLLWNTSDWRQLGRVETQPGSLNFAAFTPDGAGILTADQDGQLRLWDRGLVSVATIRQGSRAEGRVSRFTFCPASKRVAVVLHSSTVGLWGLEGGGDGPLFGEPGFCKSIDDLALSPDGRLLATGRVAGDVELWEVATRQRVAGRRTHPATVTALVFSPDGRTLASGAEDGTLKLWEVPSGPTLR